MTARETIHKPNASGAYLAQAREALGLSVAEVAEAVGFTPDTIRRWEREGLGPRASAESAVALCHFLRLDIDELYRRAKQLP